MSIELFVGKSNIFESNQRSGKILSEIHPSLIVAQDRKLLWDEDLQNLQLRKEKIGDLNTSAFILQKHVNLLSI